MPISLHFLKFRPTRQITPADQRQMILYQIIPDSFILLPGSETSELSATPGS
jgi:hypothetical protein